MIFDETSDRNNSQVNCIIGGFAPGIDAEEERYATILLCNMLGGPASNSILGSILREKYGWVYNVECSYTPYRDGGIAAIMFGCDHGNLEKCVRVIRREITRLQSAPVSERRLKWARRELLGQNAIALESGEAQCITMAKSLQVFGRVFTGEETSRHIEAVTPLLLQKMACKIFSEDNLARLVYL